MKEKFITSFDGTKIHYIYKKNKKQCIIFLHGLSSGSSVWQYIMPYFSAKGYSILSIDIRGHAKSGKPDSSKKYSIYGASKDVDLIMEKEGISNAIFVCHCFGTYIAMLLYMTKPHLIKKLVFISPHIRPKDDIGYIVVGRAYLVLIHALRLVYRKKYYSTINWDEFRPIKDLDFLKLFKLIKVASPQTMLNYLKEIYSFDGVGMARRIAVPVLIIHGSRDIIVREKYSREFSQIIRGSRFLLLKGKNHNPIVNSPDEVNEAIFEFIKEKERPLKTA
ncbi:MAG: alpha/beta hydrolase [Nanoarchaeota archaeon]